MFELLFTGPVLKQDFGFGPKNRSITIQSSCHFSTSFSQGDLGIFAFWPPRLEPWNETFSLLFALWSTIEAICQKRSATFGSPWTSHNEGAHYQNGSSKFISYQLKLATNWMNLRKVIGAREGRCAIALFNPSLRKGTTLRTIGNLQDKIGLEIYCANA